MFRNLIVFLTMSLAFALSAKAENEFTSISFSKELNGSEESAFFCTEQIWSHIIIRDITQDEMHSLRVVWRDPSGTDQEVIEKRLSADSAGEIVQFIWLKLHRPRGSAFFSLFDDTYGMTDFIGNWTLLVYVDEIEKGRGQFSVHC